MNLTHPQRVILWRLKQGHELKTRAFGHRGPAFQWATDPKSAASEQAVRALKKKGCVVEELEELQDWSSAHGNKVVLTTRGRSVQLPVWFRKEMLRD